MSSGLHSLGHVPKISVLPKLMISSGWKWRPPSPDERRYLKQDWWIGTDLQSQQWLIKMTGSSYAHREHVFASLAQRLGISCQSSTYLLIADQDPVLHRQSGDAERCQLALWFMEEHRNGSCSLTCPYPSVTNKSLGFQNILSAKNAGLANLDDMVRADVLGHLCGQLEPHGHFLTREHEYVAIDNECMFHDPPCLNQYRRLDEPGVPPLIMKLCRDFAGLPDDELRALV